MSIQNGGSKKGGGQNYEARFTSLRVQNKSKEKTAAAEENTTKTESQTQTPQGERTSNRLTSNHLTGNRFSGDSFGGGEFSRHETLKINQPSFAEGFAESAEFSTAPTQKRDLAAMARMLQKTRAKTETDVNSLKNEAGALFKELIQDATPNSPKKEVLLAFMQQTRPLKMKLRKNKARLRALKKKSLGHGLKIQPNLTQKNVDSLKLELDVSGSSPKDLDFIQLQMLTSFAGAHVQRIELNSAKKKDLHALGDVLAAYASTGLLAENMIRLLQKDFLPAARPEKNAHLAQASLLLEA